jgi:SAM-dependent methyltransferase
MAAKEIINWLYHSALFERLFPTTVYLLKKEMAGCRSVLDLGCGPSSPLQYCQNIKYSVGVEPYTPYYKIAKAKNIHTKHLHCKIENLKFAPKSFDAVILIEVLEHLTKESGIKILEESERWAKKKVIVTTPNGFVPQKGLDDNPLQKHLSGWAPKEMASLGYQVRGLSGFKYLRSNEEKCIMGDDLTASIKYSPKLFWFIIATLSQAYTYFFPERAFGLFNVKSK